MKITRLSRGFRINCSDGEFEALQLLSDLGRNVLEHPGDGDGATDDLSRAGKIGMNRLLRDGVLAVDEDRRAQ